MVIILISITWLATLLVVASVCRMAAHGERVVAVPRAGRSPRLLDMAQMRARAISLKLEDRRSKAATAEYVGNGAQKDLYVRP
jgi:hypothetical protein